MLRCRTLERVQRQKGTLREALLAATAIHLQPGDLVNPEPEDRTIVELASVREGRRDAGQTYASLLTATLAGDAAHSRLLLGAAAARGLQVAGSHGVAISFCRAGSLQPTWKQALEWACTSRLPLLTVCLDSTAAAPARPGPRRQTPLTYTALTALARRWKLPVLTVDGEDAVAVYRVIQESVLRARTGDGPALLWATMTSPAEIHRMPLSAQPLARLRRYMAVRKISLKP